MVDAGGLSFRSASKVVSASSFAPDPQYLLLDPAVAGPDLPAILGAMTRRALGHLVGIGVPRVSRVAALGRLAVALVVIVLAVAVAVAALAVAVGSRER
jgi:hypothetical protein